MSIEVLTWVRTRSTTKLSCRLVLDCLADHASNDGTDSYPSIATIAWEANVSENTVHASLRTLAAGGFITINVGQGQHGTNRYTVIMSEDPAICRPRRVATRNGRPKTPPSNLDPPINGTPPNPLETPPQSFRNPPQDPVPEPSLTVHQPSVLTLLSPDADAPEDPKPERKRAKADMERRPDVDRVCQHLHDLVIGNGSTDVRVTDDWRTDARLLMDKGGRTEAQVHRMIDWCQNDDFWKTNVRSMPALRKHYNAMKLKAELEIERAKRKDNRPTSQDTTAAILEKFLKDNEDSGAAGIEAAR